MKTTALPGAPLRRRDLVELEPLLRDALARFLPFTAHGLYFPQENAPTEPLWLSQERKLLLPLARRGALLGVFMARGVDGRAVKRLLPLLPALVELCLDNLELYHQSRCDLLTGLPLGRELLQRMVREADLVREQLAPFPGGVDGRAPLHRACMGLVTTQVRDLDDIARRHGYAFADTLLQALAAALTETLPEEVLAARTGDAAFTLLIPAATRSACQKLAEESLARLEAVSLPGPLTRQRVRPRLSCGHALYPQDMDGVLLGLPMAEQARTLLYRAGLAAAVAAARTVHGQNPAASPIVGFNSILARGGVVTELQALGRVVVSLGRTVGAREGLRFAVSAVDGAPRGEIVIMEVRESTSVAETLHLDDPARPVAPGDTLSLLGEEQSVRAAAEMASWGRDDAELLRHGDFLNGLARERENHAAFVLALMRVVSREESGEPLTPSDAQLPSPVQRCMAEAVTLCRRHLEREGRPAPALMGHYGANSLIFFHPEGDSDALLRCYGAVCREQAGQGFDVAVGLAAYPYLKFHKAEMLQCCHKALEYALLLPEPRVGLFGSLALNISADRRYSLGDVFGAVEEYKLALLADADNGMAWNSLGVCMAALARHQEARRYFKEALKRNAGDAAAIYNLGVVCQNLGEKRAAARHFRDCIAADPEHVYAHIRLGQLAEQGRRLKDARDHYSRAGALEDAAGLSCGLARRHLAGVALRQRRNDEARELLHEALIRNPQDAAAMEMLAGIYLDGGEDPAMAEMLARQSLGLRPEHRDAWSLLARALRALGREADARAADARAGSL